MYQRFRWFPREKCECIRVFVGSLAKSANASALLLVPSRKARMYQRCCSSKAQKWNVSALLLVERSKVRMYQRCCSSNAQKCECISSVVYRKLKRGEPKGTNGEVEGTNRNKREPKGTSGNQRGTKGNQSGAKGNQREPKGTRGKADSREPGAGICSKWLEQFSAESAYVLICFLLTDRHTDRQTDRLVWHRVLAQTYEAEGVV